MGEQNVKKVRVSKLLELEPLAVKKSFIPQMNAFCPKVKMVQCTQVFKAYSSKDRSYLPSFCNHKLGPRPVLLRAETESLLMQVGGHMGS